MSDMEPEYIEEESRLLFRTLAKEAKRKRDERDADFLILRDKLFSQYECLKAKKKTRTR